MSGRSKEQKPYRELTKICTFHKYLESHLRLMVSYGIQDCEKTEDSVGIWFKY